MLPMSITIMTITMKQGLVHASLAVGVLSISAQARIAMTFPPTVGTGPADWREQAYDRALMMLDPA